jgi:uracil-DNA glycosylase
MTAAPNDTSDVSNILPWLVEMGADEVLLDQPVNRFAAVEVVEVPLQPKSRVMAPPPKPKPVVNWKAVAAGAEGVAAAEALAASITSIELYADAVASFEAHPLKKTASRACSLAGNLESSILVLCDKPRNDEDRSGEVLAGNNQVLAGRMLAAIGLSDVAFANFIPWRPPGNRAPTEQEAQMLVPFARKLIELLKPKAILCFGHLPAQFLGGGEDAIMKSRGKWLEAVSAPMLTTFHPDTLLKSPASKRLAWHDLQAFKQKLDLLT